ARAFLVRLACAAVVGFSVPVRSAAQNQLIVGPKGEATVVFPNTSGSVGFSLTGLTQGQSYGWSWSCSGAVTSCTSAPGNPPNPLQLVSRSGQAHPMGIVQIDAVDTESVINPVKMSLQLYTPQATRVVFTNGSQEIFYTWASHPADGNVNRLAAEFDASGLTTGAYNYTAVVRSYHADGSFVETDVPVRLLIVNEANSPFGAGWSIAGFQKGYVLGGGVAITEGNGSIAFFTPGFTTCNNVGICTTPYTSPKGDFTTLTKTTGGTCQTPPCPTYQRVYPGGSTVGFDAN